VLTTPEKRLIVFYSLPRSGSTYVERLLGPYFQQHGSHTPLAEAFNPNLELELLSNGEIRCDPSRWRAVDYQLSLSDDERLRLLEERFIHLMKSKGNYSLKLLGAQLHKPYVYKLLESSTLVFMRRENVWEHLLSYLISYQTNQFYESEGLRWENNELSAQRVWFEKFCWLKQRYHTMRELFGQGCPEIVFEELLKRRSDYLIELGFTLPCNWEALPVPRKQNMRDKSLAFSNLDELKSWYKASPLASLYQPEWVHA